MPSAPEPSAPEPSEIILVPVDFTGPSLDVVQAAATLASRLGSQVALLYVVRLPAGLSPDTLIHPHGSDQAIAASAYLDDDAREHLQPMVQVFLDAGCTVGITLAHGDPCDAILERAETLSASMIVMGTHGRRGLRRLMEGSVAEHVIRRATCPVLTVRTPEEEEEEAHLSAAQEEALRGS